MVDRIGVGGVMIDSKLSVKLLGVTITSKLSWKEHVEKLLTELNVCSGAMKRLAQKLPWKSLIPLIHGHILSRIRYAIAIYGVPRLEDGDLLNYSTIKIQIFLNHVMRFIKGKKKSDRISVLYLMKMTAIPSDNQMIVESLLNETHKALSMNIQSVSDRLNSEFLSHGTRQQSRKTMNVPLASGSFVAKATSLWNKLLGVVRHIEENNQFRLEMKNFIRNIPVWHLEWITDYSDCKIGRKVQHSTWEYNHIIFMKIPSFENIIMSADIFTK